ncbi:unnamed protein product [Rhizophagus irregularis]|nr:unnamed protein product [Rhizophagus irregularis]
METNYNIENNSASFHTGKTLASWTICDQFISNWGKSNGFGVIKDKVVKEGVEIRRRTYICEHERKYTCKSAKETSTKKMLCLWHVNASCPKVNNPDSAIFINKIVDEHNHDLSVEAVKFREDKKFNDEMFRPTAKSLSNDAAQMSDWLDEQKERDSRWIIARGWDDNNTLTHLLWMTPEQIVEATGIHPTVIMTDSDPAVDAAVKEVFTKTYPVHCAFHITQNLHKNLRKPLGDNYEKFLQDFYRCRNSLV